MKGPGGPTLAYASILPPEVPQPMSSPCPGDHQLAARDPRADAAVAEPPAIVIRKTRRRGLCKASFAKGARGDT